MAREPKTYDLESNKRAWQCTFVDTKRVRNHRFDISIITSTRTEHPTFGVPSKIYSSLKYDQQHIIAGDLLQEFGFIVVKVHVINPETGEEIKMVNRPILKGTTEASVAAQGSPPTVQAKLRWQFTGCSYHHQRKKFTFIASYYTPQDLETPLIQKTSAPFLVYARKPTPSDPMAKAKPRGIHTKRMREGNQGISNTGREGEGGGGMGTGEVGPRHEGRVKKKDTSPSTPSPETPGKRKLKPEDIEQQEGQPPAKAARPSLLPEYSNQQFPFMEQQYGQLPDLHPTSPDKKELLNTFRSKVEELEHLREQLTPEQQDEATNLIYHKLLHTNPPYYGMPTQNQQFNIPQSQDVLDLGALLPFGLTGEEDNLSGQGSPNGTQQLQYFLNNINNNNNLNNNLNTIDNQTNNQNNNSNQNNNEQQTQQTSGQQQSNYPSVLPSPQDFYSSSLLS